MFTYNDLIGMGATYLFVISTLVVAELLRSKLGLKPFFTRKVIHINTGHWIFLWPLYDHWYALVIPPLTFVVINYISYKKELIKAMERKEKAGGLGTVYYAFSMALIAGLFWYLGKPWIGAVGAIVMAWADGVADLFGRRYGKHKYTIIGSTKSIEGSLAFLVFGFLATFISLAIYSNIGMFEGGFSEILLISIISSLIGMIIEAISPKGTDNITVPIALPLIILALYGK
ncbi:MAG: hypothetical protein DRJ32_06625 [Thermoprotei archaeon]|nr:MAG: hypothetical protein DRJ32_06625 [Thermoprotei archaeon]